MVVRSVTRPGLMSCTTFPRRFVTSHHGRSAGQSPNWSPAWSPRDSAQGRVVHLDVEDCSEELLRQQPYAIKNQLGHLKLLTRGLLLAGSLWHKGAYNRTFPCMEANYSYVIKNQRGASP